jgi:hypothetical protein
MSGAFAVQINGFGFLLWSSIESPLMFTIGLWNPQAKQRENVTLMRISLLDGVGNCHGLDNGVTLKPA